MGDRVRYILDSENNAHEIEISEIINRIDVNNPDMTDVVILPFTLTRVRVDISDVEININFDTGFDPTEYPDIIIPYHALIYTPTWGVAVVWPADMIWNGEYLDLPVELNPNILYEVTAYRDPGDLGIGFASLHTPSISPAVPL